MQVSKAVLSRFKIASTIISALDFHVFEVVGALERALFPEGFERTFDVEQVLLAHRDLLIRTRERMRQTDEALGAEAADDKPYRDARDEAVTALRRVLQDVRAMLTAAYDEDVLTFYACSDEPPRSPDLLGPYAERVLECMRHRPLSEASPYGFDLDLGVLADKVEAELVPMKLAMKDIEREVREIREALATRNEALEDFDRVYSAVAESVHAYFLLADRPDLAEHVRPTPRRRQGVPEHVDLSERSSLELDEEMRQAR
ncbi:MAG: hypothetical protein AAGI01_18285 [Myxococcota bacterium]